MNCYERAGLRQAVVRMYPEGIILNREARGTLHLGLYCLNAICIKNGDPTSLAGFDS